MESEKLFDEFDVVSSKEWKQKIQFELKGADYNETLVWESPEGIKVKPFYHVDEFENNVNVTTNVTDFKILQNVFVHNVSKANEKAKNTLNRGAESIRFSIENDTISLEDLFADLPNENTSYSFYLPFISNDFVTKINAFKSHY
jgi:methylmalonyl-CoA mutase